MPESADVAITTVTVILIITSIVGNSLVCAVIKKNRDMRYIHRWNSAIITDNLIVGQHSTAWVRNQGKNSLLHLI